MTAMLFRLAFAGMRSRLLASALTIAIAGAASATIVLALEVRSIPGNRRSMQPTGHTCSRTPRRRPTRALSGSCPALPNGARRSLSRR